MAGKAVVIPKKVAQYIENGKTHYRTRHNVVAYALHSYSVGEKELSKENVLKIVDAVYHGYTTK